MPEENSNPFRERLEVKAEGTFVEAPRPRGPEGLVVTEESFDLKRDFNDFTGKPKEMTDAAEVAVDKEGFTVEDVEVGKLDEALQAIQRQKLDEQIRDLIEEALQLIDEKNFSEALNVLEAARGIAPTSVSVLYLMGFCLFSIERFEDAHNMLEGAQQCCDNADLLLSILALQGACMRAIVEDVEAQLAILRNAGREEAMLRLVEDRLRRYPFSVTLLYHHCAILIRLGRAEQAKRAAEEAIERGGEENADLFRQMLEQATLLGYRPLLEPARQALRISDAAKALKLLRACRTTLNGLPFYETVCIYARGKDHTPSGFVSIFSRKKEQSSSLAGEELQKVLRWLLSDELDAAYNAIEKPDYATAIVHLRRAAGIDSHCSQINYLHGLAIYRNFLERINNRSEPLNLEQCARDLKRAAEYVQNASADPALAERSKELGNAIKSYQQQVADILREIELLKKYNEFLDYLERSSIGTMKEWNSAREKFLNFKQQAQTLRLGRSKDQGREILDRLIEALDSHLATLDKMKGEVQKHTLLNECLAEYNEMVARYKRYPIRTYAELSGAKASVHSLLAKLARARESLGYNATFDSGSRSSFRDVVTNWQSGGSLNTGMPRTKPAHIEQKTWDFLNLLEESLLAIQRDLNSAGR